MTNKEHIIDAATAIIIIAGFAFAARVELLQAYYRWAY